MSSLLSINFGACLYNLIVRVHVTRLDYGIQGARAAGCMDYRARACFLGRVYPDRDHAEPNSCLIRGCQAASMGSCRGGGKTVGSGEAARCRGRPVSPGTVARRFGTVDDDPLRRCSKYRLSLSHSVGSSSSCCTSASSDDFQQRCGHRAFDAARGCQPCKNLV